jgi:hypothetical protein
MPKRKPRNLGSIYTPVEFARLLVEWGVRDQRDNVLDLGIGEGVFTFLAFERLQKLGASSGAASNQLYGSEIHAPTFETFIKQAKERNVTFPNINRGNFLTRDFPEMDSVLGNPPYVRRRAIKDFDKLSGRNENASDEYRVSPLSDLYIYFLLRAVSTLKVGGRLAIITADTWLNARYGETLKKVLRDSFDVESLISFDRAVFPDAQVKPVLLFATKTKSVSPRRNVWFIRAQNGLPPIELLTLVNRQNRRLSDTSVTKIKSSDLVSSDTWGKHFKSPELIKEIASHELMTELQKQFKTYIGVQTLANDFFVLSPRQIESLQIEDRFLSPFAHSSQRYKAPLIEESAVPTRFLFCCSDTKQELSGTKALTYIEEGERREVPVRGKGLSVIGYQNKDRIKEAKRPHWYDLQTELNKRTRARILLPRVFSRNFQVVWNRADFIAGDTFIECTPTKDFENDMELCLAALTNSLTELFVRVQSQLYGGGAHTVSPLRIKEIPVINLNLISEENKELLRRAYRTYITATVRDRSVIDSVLYSILKLDVGTQNQIAETLRDLVKLSTTAKAKFNQPEIV